MSRVRLNITREGKGKSVIVFIHGWPDNPSLWKHQVEALRSEYECALVHLPFCSNDAVDNEGFSQLGYSLPKLGEMAVKTIEDEFPDGRDMYLICHDWGAMIGYEMMALRPKMFKKCIAVDVGPMTSTSGVKSLCKAGMMYQWYLFIPYFLAFISTRLATWVYWKILQWLRAASKAPLPILEDYKRYGNPKMCFYYPWFQTQGFLFALFGIRFVQVDFYPPIPCYYIFGSGMFHSKSWSSNLEKRRGSKVMRIGKGHWVMWNHSKLFNEEVRSFLKDSEIIDKEKITQQGIQNKL